MKERCQICVEAGMGDASYGHFRNVHFEGDKLRREQICLILSRSCFPSRFDTKRKFEK